MLHLSAPFETHRVQLGFGVVEVIASGLNVKADDEYMVISVNALGSRFDTLLIIAIEVEIIGRGGDSDLASVI